MFFKTECRNKNMLQNLKKRFKTLENIEDEDNIDNYINKKWGKN